MTMEPHHRAPAADSAPRRQLLRLAAHALVAAPALALTARGHAAASPTLARLPRILRTIPSTGEQIPAIGLGTNNFTTAHYGELRAVLQRMQALGGSIIDTATDYADSEVVIGRAMAELGNRTQLFIATKCIMEHGQPSWVPASHTEPVFGQEAFDRSLQRLQTPQVDLMLAHFIPSLDPMMPLLRQWKASGQARYIGVCTEKTFEHEQLATKMRQHPLDFVQLDYSIANRVADRDLLPLAMERKMAVMVDTPLGGRHVPLMKQVEGHTLPSWAADIDASSWSQFCLKYVISHPAVTCAIPGTTNIEHLVDDQLAGHGRLPDATMRREMERYWDATFPA